MFHPKKTVDGILSAFSRTIADLENVMQANNQESLAKQEEIIRLEGEVEAHAIESDRAKGVAEKLRSIIE